MPIPALLAAPLAEFVVTAGKQLIDSLFPDKIAQAKERAEAEFKLLQLTQTERLTDKANETALALKQIDTNIEEAKSDSLFKSGWRPATGWTCVGGLVYTVIYPLVVWVSNIYSIPTPPTLETDQLYVLLTGLLGLGAYRSYEKTKSKAPKVKAE